MAANLPGGGIRRGRGGQKETGKKNDVMQSWHSTQAAHTFNHSGVQGWQDRCKKKEKTNKKEVYPTFPNNRKGNICTEAQNQSNVLRRGVRICRTHNRVARDDN